MSGDVSAVPFACPWLCTSEGAAPSPLVPAGISCRMLSKVACAVRAQAHTCCSYACISLGVSAHSEALQASRYAAHVGHKYLPW